MKTYASACLLLLALLVSACGGGGGGSSAVTAAMPPTVQATPSAVPIATPTAAATAVPSAVPAGGVRKHVMVAGYIYGYAGTPASVPITTVAQYVDWAQTSASYVQTIKSAGIGTMGYVNFWRNYTTDYPKTGYEDLAPGGPHASAAAKDCSGNVLYDPAHGGGYEADARAGAALDHALLVTNNGAPVKQSGFDAIFSDDTGAVDGMLPCGYVQPAYDAAVNALDSSLAVPMWINALGAFADPSSALDLLQPANVLGAMCESCYGANSSSGDFVITGTSWQRTENAEIGAAAMHKIFWDYARMTGDPSSETTLRLYVYASFLLGYEPSYAMFQEAFKTASGFPVMPETGLVPANPLATASSVQGYRTAGGAYVREFGACYYRGAPLGKCAVAVNPASSSVSLALGTYAHSLVLTGSGVLDGGTAAFNGPAVTQLGGASAAILFQ